MNKFAEQLLRTTDDESLRETAREMDPRQLLTVLEAAAEDYEDAQRAVRERRNRLNLLVKVGLERDDVVNRDIARRTGIAERAVYKRARPDRV